MYEFTTINPLIRKIQKAKLVKDEVESEKECSKMQFAVKDTLTEEEVQSGLRTNIKDGMASTSMAKLTGGAFLVALALKLDASNLVIGLLATIPPLAKLLQISSIYLVERIRNRRAISVAASSGIESFGCSFSTFSRQTHKAG